MERCILSAVKCSSCNASSYLLSSVNRHHDIKSVTMTAHSGTNKNKNTNGKILKWIRFVPSRCLEPAFILDLGILILKAIGRCRNVYLIAFSINPFFLPFLLLLVNTSQLFFLSNRSYIITLHFHFSLLLHLPSFLLLCTIKLLRIRVIHGGNFLFFPS